MKSLLVAICLASLIISGCTGKQSTTAPTPVAVAPAKSEPKPAPPAHTGATLKKEISLFDGQTLTGWKELDFAANGGVDVEQGTIKLHMGGELTGMVWTNAAVLPKQNYEIELDAMKLMGTDFFCGLTFPVGTNFCSLILGGWGGSVVGISSLDGMDASENDTSRSMAFEKNRWYRIRLQVTPKEIRTWIDDSKVIDVGIEDRKVAMRFGEIERCVPLGLSTWQTSAAYRNIKIKPIGGSVSPDQ